MRILKYLACVLAIGASICECEKLTADVPVDRIIFDTYTWHELAACYNSAMKSKGTEIGDSEMERLTAILKKGNEYRLNLIGKTLTDVYCSENGGKKSTSLSKGLDRITCNDSTKKPELKILSFGSTSPTSDYDFSIDFVGKAEDLETVLSRIDAIAKLIEQLENSISAKFKGKSMTEVLDSNAYPEIMDIYNDFYANDSPMLATEQGRTDYNEYKLAIRFNMCEAANSLLISTMNRKLTQGEIKADLLQGIMECKPFGDLSQINKEWITKMRRQVFFPSTEDHHQRFIKDFTLTNDQKHIRDAFTHCLRMDSKSISKWQSFAKLPSCHIYAGEAYVTFGALEMVKPREKTKLYNCRSLAEAFYENFGMLYAHSQDIYTEKSSSTKYIMGHMEHEEIVVNFSSSSKLKYFWRMMDALKQKECYFLGDPNNLIAEKKISWNLIEKQQKAKFSPSSFNEPNIIKVVLELSDKITEIRSQKFEEKAGISEAEKKKLKDDHDRKIKGEILQAVHDYWASEMTHEHLLQFPEFTLFERFMHPFIVFFKHFSFVISKEMSDIVEKLESRMKIRI